MLDLAEPEVHSAAEPAAGTPLLEVTAEFVNAYVTRNHVRPADMPTLIATVHGALSGLGQATETEPELAPVRPRPPVPIRTSVTDEYIVSLEDGKRHQTLKRHLDRLGLTPQQYRAKWGLPNDYPMVAPVYSAKRSALARGLGFGKQRGVS